MGNYKIYKYTNKINNKVYIGQTRQSIKNRAQGKGWGYKKCPHFFFSDKTLWVGKFYMRSFTRWIG